MAYPKAEQPDGLSIDLFPHQLTSIYYLERLERMKKIKINDVMYIETSMGIFGDMPGYGKSLSMVSIIMNDNMEWDMSTQYEKKVLTGSNVTGIYASYCIQRLPKINTTLVLVPSTVIPQWEEYFSYTELEVESVIKKSTIEDLTIEDLANIDVLLVTPTMFNQLTEKFQNYAWKRFVYDEPSSTNVPAMKAITAGFSWFITATYEQLRYIGRSNGSHFLKTIFGSMSYTNFDQFVIKNNEEYVRRSFVMPEVIQREYKCFNPHVVNAIRGHIAPNVMEMINAGNIKEAIQHLGGNDSNGNIIDLVTKKYKFELRDINHRIDQYRVRDGEQSAGVKTWTDKKREIEGKIKDIEDRFSDMLKNDCPICRCEIENPVMMPCCQNIFCGACMLDWCKDKPCPTCPMCRTNVNFKTMIYITDGTEEKQEAKVPEKPDENKILPKPETIVKIITELQRKKENPKIIIFSSYDETFTIIKRFLDSSDIDYKELKGSVFARKKIVKAYKTGQAPVIFLNSNYNGAGINLQETTDIILYHEMTHDVKTQLLGRANRIGRKESLTVHTLV